MEAPEADVMRLPLMSGDDVEATHKATNPQPPTGNPANVCLHQLFEAAAEQNPDTVCIRAESGSFTYAQVSIMSLMVTSIAAGYQHHIKGTSKRGLPHLQQSACGVCQPVVACMLEPVQINVCCLYKSHLCWQFDHYQLASMSCLPDCFCTVKHCCDFGPHLLPKTGD